MNSRWIPAPRYLVRKQCVLRMMRDLPPGRVLEIGCAQGDLLRTLAERGYSGTGVDFSVEAVTEARDQTLADFPEMTAGEPGIEEGAGLFDYVLSFEVLEHIEDDRKALSEWRARLRDGGRLIVSVPAHQRWWSQLDVFAGHYRRYSRRMLTERLGEAGFRVETIWSYGFPIANVSHLGNRYIAMRKLQEWKDKDRRKRTEDSGIDRSAIKAFAFLWNNPLFMAVAKTQFLFVKTDWGNGYLTRAVAV